MSLIKLYSWNSIFFKYFRKSLVYILMPLTILSLVLCFFVFRSRRDDAITQQNRAFYHTASVLNAVFNDVENNHLVVSSSSDISSFCTENNITFESRHATKKLIENICISSQYINNIHIYIPSRDYVFSTMVSAPKDDFYIKDWYNILSETEMSDFVYYNKSSDSSIYSDSVIIVRSLRADNYIIGYILYDIHVQSFKEIFEESGYEYTLQLLCDTKGNIFYSSDKTLVDTNICDINADVNLSDFGDSALDGNNLFLSSDINYTYRYITSASIASGTTAFQIAGIVLAVALFVLLISFVLSFYLSLHFYKSIIQITATLRNEENGDKYLSDQQYNELYYINSHIVSRLTKISDMETQLAQQITALKKAQFVALQTQLNPHFIYNTLNLINVMVMKMAKRDCDASKAIVMLSQLLRGAFDTKTVFISIHDELEYTRRYIELQKLKFKYDMNIVWDVDGALINRKILKFMLQPIVENAFEHGFGKTKLDEYTLIISAHADGDELVLSVTNNGKKIDDDELISLQEALRSDIEFEHRGIGLMNVNQRIRLIYGDNYGCSIESTDDETTISMRLPAEFEQNNI